MTYDMKYFNICLQFLIEMVSVKFRQDPLDLCLEANSHWEPSIYFYPLSTSQYGAILWIFSLSVILNFMTLDSGVLSTLLWPSSHSTSPPSVPSALLRAPLHHSLQWTRSLLSPLILLFPLFCSRQDRKTEEIQQERRRERGNGWRQAERDGGISLIFFFFPPLFCIIDPIHTLKEKCKNQTKEANFTVLHMHNRLVWVFKKKKDQTHLSRWGWMYYPQRIKMLHIACSSISHKEFKTPAV